MPALARPLSLADRLCMSADNALRTLTGAYRQTERAEPAAELPEAELSADERREVAGLMRVNHVGEICAQALYAGQALTARLPEVRGAMERAALEENDHLAWCAARVEAMDSHLSWLNPLWYAGSFAIGAGAGLAGDRWSLGFVAETERQVVSHLEGHLQRLPEADRKSRAVLEVMREDEEQHRQQAQEAGGSELPAPVRGLMAAVSKLMTGTAYHL
ncbi:MAG: 2-polyprenyl-3-methyl-6-methoxy-1,4-benzoquinone monooxygenase [Gammaproteobacteria bacterium]|nr:2-polyprenyl-3-methyl-6-methoxy-1,4-benzoquinone monooxygenase [Gammaproteobacteria bacterium]